MQTADEILFDSFEALRLKLIEAYDAKGMRSSGKWADSLETVVTEKMNGGFHAAVLGLPYSQQLETGRRPGKQPPSSVIMQWLIDKGIAARLQGEISISSLAFLIARKIGRQGWKREEYGGVELISEVVTAEAIQQIIDSVSAAYLPTITSDIIRHLKSAAA